MATENPWGFGTSAQDDVAHDDCVKLADALAEMRKALSKTSDPYFHNVVAAAALVGAVVAQMPGGLTEEHRKSFFDMVESYHRDVELMYQHRRLAALASEAAARASDD